MKKVGFLVKELGLANEETTSFKKRLLCIASRNELDSVDDALERLRSVSKCLVETEKMSAKDAIGGSWLQIFMLVLAVLLMQILLWMVTPLIQKI